MAAHGTKLPIWNVRVLVAIEGKADETQTWRNRRK
jgi:hypothetical protein